jgi:hypothetical protein
MIAEAIAFVAGVYVTYLLSWSVLIALFVLGIGLEYARWRGPAVAVGLVSMTVVGSLLHANTWWEYAVVVAGYLILGIVVSFWRYKRHLAEKLEHVGNIGSDLVRYVLAKLHPLKMVDTIVAWIIIWPFVIVEYAFKDVIAALKSVVTKCCRGKYMKIYNNALAAVGISSTAE